MKIKHDWLSCSLRGGLLGFCYIQCSKFGSHVPPKRPNKLTTLHRLRSLKTSMSATILKACTVSSEARAVPWLKRSFCWHVTSNSAQNGEKFWGRVIWPDTWTDKLTFSHGLLGRKNAVYLMWFKFNWSDFWAEKSNISQSSNKYAN